MKRKAHLIKILAFISLSVVSAIFYLYLENLSNKKKSAEFFSKLAEKTFLGKNFQLSEITDFPWDNVCVLYRDVSDHSTPTKSVSEFVYGSDLQFKKNSQSIGDLQYFILSDPYVIALIFVKNGKVESIYKNDFYGISSRGRKVQFKESPTNFGTCSDTASVTVNIKDHSNENFTIELSK